jgi:hypothetical protein
MDATSTREGYYFSRSVTAEALFKEKFTGDAGIDIVDLLSSP